jgi:O-antigen/teichoic acid export membrane protein
VQLTLLRPVLKNNAALLVQYAAGAAVPLLLVPHLARSIGLESFGVLSVLLAWAAWGTAAVGYVFHLTGPAAAAEDPEGVPALLGTVLAARTALLAIVVPALLVVYATGLIPASTWPAVLLILVALPAAAALNTSWHLQVHHRFAEPAALSVFGTGLALACGLLFVRGNDSASVGWAAAALVVGSVVVGAGSLAISVRLAGGIGRARRTQVFAALQAGKPLFIAQLAALAYAGSGPIVIGWLAGLEQAGTYGVLDRLFSSVAAAALLLHTAAYPTLAQLFRSDRRAYLKLVGLVTATYLAASLAIVVLGWVFREPVLGYLYGSAGPRPQLLYLLGLLWVGSGIFGTVVTGYFVVSGQPRRVYRLTLQVLAVSLALGIPGVLLYGSAGWMGGLLVAQGLVIITALQQWKKEHDAQRR